MAYLRAAFLEESGAALIRQYADIDPLFTTAGYTAYADDLLARMVNPYLRDTVARVARDPARKLGWHDRLIGTLRLALRHGIAPSRFSVGAAAALAALDPSRLDCSSPVSENLFPLWQGPAVGTREREAILSWIGHGHAWLRRWRDSGFQSPENIVWE